MDQRPETNVPSHLSESVECCGETRAAKSGKPGRGSVSSRLTVKESSRAPGATLTPVNPDHAIHIKKLNRVIGQLQGIQRMITSRRYCPDILNQTRAAASAIRSVEMEILETHIRHCVANAMAAPNAKAANANVEELVDIFSRF